MQLAPFANDDVIKVVNCDNIIITILLAASLAAS